MSFNRNVMVSAIIAILIAISLIAVVAMTGLLTTTFTTENQATSSGQTNINQPSSSSGTGTLAVLMTDPPTVPNGVSAIYIQYSNLAVHVSGAGNNTGWHLIDSGGQIDLMSIINVTQTIGSASIQTGTFDALAFNISSATVTFQGKNYSADLVYQEHTLFVRIPGGVSVTAGQTSAAVIDLTPTVLLLGNLSNPGFVFIPAARAYTIPSQAVPALHLHVGGRDDIHTAQWWMSIRSNSNFEIMGITLKVDPSTELDTLSLTVQNTGESELVFKLAAISSTNTLSGGNKQNALPSVASISEFFVVEPNATLVPILTGSRAQMSQMMTFGGYLLPSSESVTFTYTGRIAIGALGLIGGNPVTNLQLNQTIVQGQMYVVTIMAGNRVAQGLITAQ